MKFEQQLSQKQTQTQTQQLKLTQELQQSLQVLQFSGEELFSFINQQTLENPLIELNDKYFTGLSRPGNTLRNTAMATEVNFGQIADNEQSLFDYLLTQVHLNYRETPLKKVVILLLSYIDNQGFLRTPLDDISKELNQPYLILLDALVLLQQLDPAGVAARNLQECLMLQTERDDDAPNIAYVVLESYFDLFVERKWADIAKQLTIEIDEVQRVFDYVQTLTPSPGGLFQKNEGMYIVPDIKVKNNGNELEIQATKSVQPPLKLNATYFDQFLDTKDKEVQAFIKEKKQKFDWLKKMVDQRGNTILRVGEAIVRHQKEFFLNEEHPLKPLILKDIAEELQLHESTVSRTVNGKYLETTFGVYELKHFFSTKLTNASGEEISTIAVKNHLEKFIKNEDKSKPLSDQKIAAMMDTLGIKISRRTIAKYREELGILGSSKRKRFE